MRKWLKKLFREMSSEYPVVVNVSPTPVTVNPTPISLDEVAISNRLCADVNRVMLAALASNLEVVAKQLAPLPVPAPVVDVDKLLSGVAEQMYAVIDKKLVDTVNEALKPRLPEQPLDKQSGNPTTEGKLLSLLPSDVQKAARFGCRHVQSESRFPLGGKVLGHNYHRDEACERAMTWLQERCLQYRASDVHLACELYYRVYIKGESR